MTSDGPVSVRDQWSFIRATCPRSAPCSPTDSSKSRGRKVLTSPSVVGLTRSAAPRPWSRSRTSRSSIAKWRGTYTVTRYAGARTVCGGSPLAGALGALGALGAPGAPDKLRPHPRRQLGRRGKNPENPITSGGGWWTSRVRIVGPGVSRVDTAYGPGESCGRGTTPRTQPARWPVGTSSRRARAPLGPTGREGFFVHRHRCQLEPKHEPDNDVKAVTDGE